jgi:hypothetical protein
MKIDNNKYTVHPSAIVDDGAQIGEGSRAWYFARKDWATLSSVKEVCSQGEIFK